jgi:hypothetical protein
MKTTIIGVLSVIMFVSVQIIVFAQDTTTDQQSQKPVIVIVKNDGSRFVGTIISEDAREVLIETQSLGQVYIPRHEIKEIREAVPGEISSKGEFIPAEVFSTRYFITTNGLPVKKGETYMLMSLFGPDFQFGVSDNLGLGILTTWFATPIIGSLKYSIPINEKTSVGLGALAGTGSWVWPEFGLILPYGVITSGDRVRNINLSLGYGGVTYKRSEYISTRNGGYTKEVRENEGTFLVSVAGMVKVGKSISLVFDSFIVPRSGTIVEYEDTSYFDWERNIWIESKRRVERKKYSFAIFIPGMRFQTNPNSAFQFGFAGIRAEGETLNVPFPMLQWFRML